MRAVIAATLLVLTLDGCVTDPGHSLSVDLRTDYLPGVEFTTIETSVSVGEMSLGSIPASASMSEDFVGGRRIAEFTDLEAGQMLVRVALRNIAGELLDSRLVILQVRGDTGVTLHITRSCAGVSCPGSTDDAEATECLNGLCVPPTCISSDSCGGASCTTGASCDPSMTPCAENVCAGPACFQIAHHERCPMAERCDPDLGCIPDLPPDASVDAWMSDAEPDTSIVDSGMEAGPMDSGLDSSMDARADSSMDSGIDTSFDSSFDGSEAGCRCVPTGVLDECMTGIETDCFDGFDNDCDLLTDCSDPDCSGSGLCFDAGADTGIGSG